MSPIIIDSITLKYSLELQPMVAILIGHVVTQKSMTKSTGIRPPEIEVLRHNYQINGPPEDMHM